MTGRASKLRPFIEPESVVFVGITRETGLGSFNAIENLLRYKYGGKVYLVNPKAEEILGMKSYPSVSALPEKVDLAVVLTSRTITPGIIRECAAKGIPAAIIMGQGFADATDALGKQLQEEIIHIARESGIRIMGPNTVGVANAFTDFSTSFMWMKMEEVPVGIVCQSGVFFGRFHDLTLLGKGIDLGNACDIDFADALEYYEDDPQVKVIVLHIEGMPNGRRFLEVARRVAQKKPIIALKAGRGERSRKAIQTHTGSMVGRDESWDAAFKQCGIIRLDDVDEIRDVVQSFICLPPLKGNRVAAASFSGAGVNITLDACERHNLRIASLSPETEKKLEDISPLWLGTGNPMDIWPSMVASEQPIGETFASGVRILLEDPNVDALFIIAGAWMEQFNPSLSQVIIKMTEGFPDKPIVCWAYETWTIDTTVKDLAEKIEKEGRSVMFSSVERAIRTLGRLAKYWDFRRRSAIPLGEMER